MSSGKPGSAPADLERKYDGKWAGNLTIHNKESDNYMYTAFIKQLINIVIESAIDKYEKESCYPDYIVPGIYILTDV